MKVDMHIHTNVSREGPITIDRLRKICLKKNIFPFITDHNTIKGALAYREKYKDCVVGEEIKAVYNGRFGDITGLFVNEEIKRDLDIFEAIDKIKAQGALVYFPHPYDRFRKRSAFFEKNGEFDLKNKIDIVEIYNSRIFGMKDMRKAISYSDKINAVKGAGSDAHWPIEIGRSYAEVNEFDRDNPKEFLKNLKDGKLFMIKKGNLVLLTTTRIYAKINSRFP
ncbi:MAG: PHP-associated domain-containing protein [Candidatus Nanoarchaeia archaeon]|nr:PHP-associated domain-containing protein [Candidatus Nanoarchaeia archaeon]